MSGLVPAWWQLVARTLVALTHPFFKLYPGFKARAVRRKRFRPQVLTPFSKRFR